MFTPAAKSQNKPLRISPVNRKTTPAQMLKVIMIMGNTLFFMALRMQKFLDLPQSLVSYAL